MNLNPDNRVLSQGFGVNPRTYAPLAGHPAVDISNGYGSPIHTAKRGFVYKILSVNQPANDGSGFTGVFMIVDDGFELYELLFGHCDPKVIAGQWVNAGDVIGTEANHGMVWVDGKEITLAMQRAGDKRGSHVHLQKRPVRKAVSISTPALSAWNTMGGGTYRDEDGHYYPIWDYYNGYNGCVDPTKSVFVRNLQNGMTGYDVFVLQRILTKQGFFTDVPTGYFGPKTQTALGLLQDRIGIQPDAGFFGPKTRQAVVNMFGV